MDTTNIPSNIKQAMEIIAEINDLFGEITQWAGGDADAAIKELFDNWQELMSKSETAISKKFIDECTKLLKGCISFREDIVEKSQFFAKNTKDKISSINKLAGDDKEIESMLKDVLKLWNEFGQPRLEFLFEKAEELESSIRDIMDEAMRPIEAITKTPK